MTALRVDPNGRFLWLTDRELSDYPFIYMVEPGSLSLSDPEVDALRKYLLNGGFLWFDDFWGPYEWANVEREMKLVFPDLSFVELSLTNALYHCVVNITAKNIQVPNVDTGTQSQWTGITWEKGGREVHIAPSSMTRDASWFSPLTTPTTETAGNGRATTLLLP